MNSTTPLTSRIAAPAAMAASAVLGVMGVIQVTDAQSGESTVRGIEHVGLAGFGLSLLLLVPAVLHLGRLAGRPKFAAVSTVGMTILALLTVVSNVRGEDPSFFAAVAAPTNLMWFGGYIALAIALKRSGRVPTAIAVGLPISWICTLPLSMFGGPILAGAYWLVVGWLLAHGELPRRAVPVTA